MFTQLDNFLQLESLYSFNSKFLPKWQSRYIVYQDNKNLPQIAFVILQAERLLKVPKLRFLPKVFSEA